MADLSNPEELFSTANNTSIEVYSGRFVDLLNPAASLISIEDIAHALSFQARFTGHGLRFISVAEHSIVVCEMLPWGLKLEGLLHDAAEAYLHDMSRPLKYNTELGRHYKELEEKWEKVIRQKFGLPPERSELVTRADNVATQLEIDENMPRGLRQHRTFFYYNPQEAQRAFLSKFRVLMEI